MANPPGKKVTLLVPPELIKAAKLKAAQAGQPLIDWLLEAIEEKLQAESLSPSAALDWGRIDSRIDQRTASLEQQVEVLTSKVELLLSRSAQHSLEERTPLLNSGVR